MLLIIASGPGVVMAPTTSDVRGWAVAALICAALLLIDAVVTAYMLRRGHPPVWRRLPALMPALLGAACLVYSYRVWLAAAQFPAAPKIGGVTGDCALCRTLDGYSWGVLVIAALTVFMLLGSAVYLAGEVR